MVFFENTKNASYFVLFGKLMQNILTRNDFLDFENIVDIWLLKYFMKLLESGLCISNTLTCELLRWVCPGAIILVITLFL